MPNIQAQHVRSNARSSTASLKRTTESEADKPNFIRSRFITINGVTPGLEQKLKSNLPYYTENFVWRVKFTAPLDAATINNVNLYVTNASNVPIKCEIRYISTTNEIEIEPLEAYQAKQNYILHITTKVQSRGGQRLKHPIEVSFHI